MQQITSTILSTDQQTGLVVFYHTLCLKFIGSNCSFFEYERYHNFYFVQLQCNWMPIIYAQYLYWYWYLKVMYWYWYWYWYLFVEYLIQDCYMNTFITLHQCTFNLLFALFSTPCLKNIPDGFSYNSRKHCRIFIIFGRNITEKVGNQKMLYFPISPN